jgi:PIN domain nuclease of toxin-antitoxin system
VRALLDTHTLLWWFSDDPSLSSLARQFTADVGNFAIVSAASAWEIAIKVRLGKLPTAAGLIDDFVNYLDREGFDPLPITLDHAIRAGLLPGFHKDPFDRMLIAQAQAESLPIISNDEIFDEYGVRRIW